MFHCETADSWYLHASIVYRSKETTWEFERTNQNRRFGAGGNCNGHSELKMPRIRGSERVGKDVFAKWPGSQQYFRAKVKDYDGVNKVYKVEFTFDGRNEEVDVLQRNVTLFFAKMKKRNLWADFTPVSLFQSQQGNSLRQGEMWRSRSASPARSPARVRRRSRSKSPSRTRRTTRSPGRKNAKILFREESPPSPEKEPPVQHVSPEKTIEGVNSKIEVQTRETRSRSVQKSKEINEESLVVTRRVTRSFARSLEGTAVKTAEELAKADETAQEPEDSLAITWRQQFESFIGIFLLPALILGLCFVCADKDQAFSFTRWPKKIPCFGDLFDWKCLLAVGFWVDFQLLLTLLPVGRVFKGRVLADGKALDYRLNGLFLFSLNVAVMSALLYTKHAFKLAALVDEYYMKIATSCIIVSFIFGIFLIILAQWDSSVKSKACTPFNFMAGVQLNPKCLNIDLKFACARISMLAFTWLIFCFVVNHIRSDAVNYPALLVAGSQFLYVVASFLLEEFTVRGREIAEEKLGFGFVLLALAVIPLFYTMQTLYLTKMIPQLTQSHWALLIAFTVLGHFIFVKSNHEKLQFRFGDSKKVYKVIFTANGKNLLVEGFWGYLRHPNYLGDILLAISWAIPAGCCSHMLPWLYPLLLVPFLIQRANEDDSACAKKYGLSWDEYKARVKYVIFPYVY
eukprot:gene20458-22474_t